MSVDHYIQKTQQLEKDALNVRSTPEWKYLKTQVSH